MMIPTLIAAMLVSFPPICADGSGGGSDRTDLHAIIYSASWCGPCKEMHADIEKTLVPLGWRIAGHDADIEFVEIDAPNAITTHFIEGEVPQLVVLRERKILARRVGKMAARDYAQWLNSFGLWRSTPRRVICAP